MAAAPVLGVVDRGLAGDDPELASRVVLMPTLDARLVMIDASAGVDKFVVLQGLEDPELPDGPERYYCFQRWGETGGRGATNLEGPMLAPSVEKCIRQAFEAKTGFKWGAVEAGHEAKEGMYWLQAVAKTEADAMWEYYIGSDGVDGKKPGWYPYTPEAAVEMEELYAQHVGSGGNDRTATRNIRSGHFSYNVDLSAMTQTNAQTRTQRDIRRVFEKDGDAVKPGRPVVKAMKAMKAMKVPWSVVLSERKKAMKAMVVAERGSAGVKKRTMKLKAMKAAPPAMKKSTKPKTSMKAMKAAPKPKKTSAIAQKTRMAFYKVVSGRKARTQGGLRKDDIEKNKWGKLVPKRKAASQKKNTWMIATKEAMKALGKTGFIPCGGSTAEGKALYKKAKEIHAAMK